MTGFFSLFHISQLLFSLPVAFAWTSTYRPLQSESRRSRTSSHHYSHCQSLTVNSYSSSTQRSQLNKIVHSIQSQLLVDEHDNAIAKKNHSLLVKSKMSATVHKLTVTQSTADVVTVGNRMESIFANASSSFSSATLDLLCQATALAGLNSLSIKLLDELVDRRNSLNNGNNNDDNNIIYSNVNNPSVAVNRFPSSDAQVSLVRSLRQLGRISLLEHVVNSLAGSRNQQHSSSIHNRSIGGMSVIAFNGYLAALCEIVIRDKDRCRKKRSSLDSTSLATRTLLDHAFIRLVEAAASPCIVRPDAFSYATVLQALAKVGDVSRFNQLWNDMESLNVTANLVAHNARLEIAYLSSDGKDEAVIQVWKEMTTGALNISPDRYSINLVLCSLVRMGCATNVTTILDDYVTVNSQSVVSLAFTAFLSTLVKGGEMSTACLLFDRYIRPSLSPVLCGNAGTLRLVRPVIRHFNILLAGYQQLHQVYHHETRQGGSGRLAEVSHQGTTTGTTEQHNTTESNDISPVVVWSYCDKAWNLHHLLQSYSDVCRPNEITVTIMITLCRSVSELLHFVRDVTITHQQVALDSAVLRATISMLGRLGDASSACWLYLVVSNRMQRNESFNLRMWNVLIGAMAQSVLPVRYQEIPMNLLSNPAAKALSSLHMSDLNEYSKQLLFLFHEKSISEGLILYLERSNRQTEHNDVSLSHLPSPDSQTYCLIATALQRSCPNIRLARSLFLNATNAGVPADGRFVNAVFRCFGDDINSAIAFWTKDVRPAVLKSEQQYQSLSYSSQQRSLCANLLAAYHGLLYVCGRASQPQLALRLVYAMRKEGLIPDETALNCYRSGTIDQKHQAEGMIAPSFGFKNESILSIKSKSLARQIQEQLGKISNPYESILLVECTQYNKNDKRRTGELRIRIVV